MTTNKTDNNENFSSIPGKTQEPNNDVAEPMSSQRILERKCFKVKAHKMGLRPDLNFDNIEEVLDILEGPYRR